MATANDGSEGETGEDDPPLGRPGPLTPAGDSPDSPPASREELSHASLATRIGKLLPIVLRRRSELLARGGLLNTIELSTWLRRQVDLLIDAGEVRVWGSQEEARGPYPSEADFTAHEVAALAAHAVLYLEAVRAEQRSGGAA